MDLNVFTQSIRLIVGRMMNFVIMRLTEIRPEQMVPVGPSIMPTTKIATLNRRSAETGIKCSAVCMDAINNLMDYLRWHFTVCGSLLPAIWMVCLHVFTVAGPQFKILYPVVCFVSVYMMYSFVLGELSPKMLFHNTAMLKDSLSINIYTHVAQLSKAWLPLLHGPPMRGGIVGSMPEHPRPVHLAYSAFGLFQDISTSFHLALLSFYHDANYNTRGNVCQV
jgi:hypothetical protein